MTTYRLWIILVATVAVTTLILVGSAVAQNSTSLNVCSTDQYGKLACDTSTDPNDCIIGGSIVRDQYTCDQSQQAPSAQNAPTVSIAANAFDPAQVQVAPGTPLTFVNDDSVAHTVSLEGLFDTPQIPAGSSYPVTLDGTGTVTYHDVANPEMKGTITVGAASQGKATTPEGSAEEPSQTADESTETADGSGGEPSQDSGQVDE